MKAHGDATLTEMASAFGVSHVAIWKALRIPQKLAEALSISIVILLTKRFELNMRSIAQWKDFPEKLVQQTKRLALLYDRLRAVRPYKKG